MTKKYYLAGNCDGILNQICHMLGAGWETPLHAPLLKESLELTPPPAPTPTKDTPTEEPSAPSGEAFVPQVPASSASEEPKDPVVENGNSEAVSKQESASSTEADSKPKEVSPDKSAAGKPNGDGDDDDEEDDDEEEDDRPWKPKGAESLSKRLQVRNFKIEMGHRRLL